MEAKTCREAQELDVETDLLQLFQNHEAPGLKSIPSLLQDCPLLPAVLATI